MTERRDTGSRPYARVFGSPGARPRFAGLVRAAWPVFVIVFAAGYLVRAAFPLPDLSLTAAGLLFLVLAVAFGAAVNASLSRLGSFLKGARGEEQVAHELAFLPAAYSVFHGLSRARGAIMPRGGDYDHVVAGPTGVFVVETKNWAGAVTLRDGRILCDGREPDRPPLEQVRLAARSLRAELRQACDAEIHVQPVVCFAGNQFAGDRCGTGGVILCNARALTAVVRESCDPPLPQAVLKPVVRTLQDWLE